MHRVEIAMKEIFDHALALGGTITGEHGVGLAKKAFLKKAVGELNFAVMKHIKDCFDPNGILESGENFLMERTMATSLYAPGIQAGRRSIGRDPLEHRAFKSGRRSLWENA